MSNGFIVGGASALVVGAFALLSAVFVVPEGHVGIVTKFSKAEYQVGPGLHFKTPFVNGVEKIEVRERKIVETLNAATKNQLPITSETSVNWSVDRQSAMDIYVEYGSLAQFEDRVLEPKLRQASKAALANFNADELIRDRNAAIAKIQEFMVQMMEGYPVTVHSPQIEDITLPPTYRDAVLAKERAREDAAKEKYNLEKQALTAAQLTQTAEAERDAQIARADGEAYRVKVTAQAEAESIILRGEAEAKAIKEVEEALKSNPLLVEYEKAKRWDGKLPTSMIPSGSVPILNVN